MALCNFSDIVRSGFEEIQLGIYGALDSALDKFLEAICENLDYDKRKRISKVFDTDSVNIDRWCQEYYKFLAYFEENLNCYRTKYAKEYPKGFTLKYEGFLIKEMEVFYRSNTKKKNSSSTVAQINYEIQPNQMVNSAKLRISAELLRDKDDSVIKFVIAHEFGHIIAGQGENESSVSYSKGYISGEAKADAVAILLTGISVEEYRAMLPEIRGQTDSFTDSSAFSKRQSQERLDTLFDMTLMALQLLGEDIG